MKNRLICLFKGHTPYKKPVTFSEDEDVIFLEAEDNSLILKAGLCKRCGVLICLDLRPKKAL